MSTLQRAIEIAVASHREQTRKNGQPYILHPIRVMLKQSEADAMIAAILHDVVEDTDVSHADLRKEGFSPVVLEAIKLLTHEDEVPYMDYVARVAAHPVARSVKLADLEDNMNLREIPEMTERDCARSRKYHTAWKRLKEFEQSHAEATSNTARSAVSEASDA